MKERLMAHTELEIRGMTCESCAVHVADALEKAGAREISIDWRRGRGTIAPDRPHQAELNQALAGTPYRVTRATDPVDSTAAPGRSARHDYDLIVLGSGGGAFAAAIRGRDLGRSVLLVEQATIGGTCVNVGCIPSKSLLV